MKTKLPERIASISEAVQFLTALHINNEAYHPEDDAHDIVWSAWNHQKPTEKERDQLNKLMEEIYALPGNDGRHNDPLAFDPCAWLLDIANEKKGGRKCLELLKFDECMTGGQCTAAVKHLPDGKQLWITNDLAHPNRVDEPVIVGLYNGDQEEVGYKTYPTLLEYFLENEQEVINELQAQKLDEQ